MGGRAFDWVGTLYECWTYEWERVFVCAHVPEWSASEVTYDWLVVKYVRTSAFLNGA